MYSSLLTGGVVKMTLALSAVINQEETSIPTAAAVSDLDRSI
jgi:hypothetical protein